MWGQLRDTCSMVGCGSCCYRRPPQADGSCSRISRSWGVLLRRDGDHGVLQLPAQFGAHPPRACTSSTSQPGCLRGGGGAGRGGGKGGKWGSRVIGLSLEILGVQSSEYHHWKALGLAHLSTSSESGKKLFKGSREKGLYVYPPKTKKETNTRTSQLVPHASTIPA